MQLILYRIKNTRRKKKQSKEIIKIITNGNIIGFFYWKGVHDSRFGDANLNTLFNI